MPGTATATRAPISVNRFARAPRPAVVENPTSRVVGQLKALGVAHPEQVVAQLHKQMPHADGLMRARDLFLTRYNRLRLHLEAGHAVETWLWGATRHADNLDLAMEAVRVLMEDGFDLQDARSRYDAIVASSAAGESRFRALVEYMRLATAGGRERNHVDALAAFITVSAAMARSGEPRQELTDEVLGHARTARGRMMAGLIAFAAMRGVHGVAVTVYQTLLAN